MGALAQAWLDCRRSKRNSASALAFEENIERNLCRLRDRLLDGSYHPGRSIAFVVLRPKPREVWAAGFEDRVVHHLLYNHIAPGIEASFHAGSAACIPGRGTLYAACRLEHQVRSITANWSRPAHYLKCDLSNFFVSIPKAILLRQLAARVRDPFWLRLAQTILMHDPRTDFEWRGNAGLLERVPPHKRLLNAPADTGLPIGNLSSQFFANVHLDALDQHVAHHLHGRRYGRYVDDFYLLHEQPERLNAALADLTAWLPATLGATLNTRKTILQPAERGIDFVGQVGRPWRRTTRRRTTQAALHRIASMPEAATFAAGNSYLGLVGQGSHPHQEQAAIAQALRRRGHAVAGDLSRIYRRANEL